MSGPAHERRDAPAALDVDLALCLDRLARRYPCKTRLAHILAGALARRQLEALGAADAAALLELWSASPLARPGLQRLWDEVADLTETFLQIESARLHDACERWTGSGAAATFVTALLAGTGGSRARAARQAAFLADRRACLDHPTPERVRLLATAVPAFVEELLADARTFRCASRELHAHARAPLALHTYGFGEISRPVGLVRHPSPLAAALAPTPLVYKRLAPFTSTQLAEQYIRIYHDYNRRLATDVGIAVPAFGHRLLRDARGRPIVIGTQAALDPRSIGKAILLQRDAPQCLVLFRMVLGEYRKLASYNQAQRAAGFAIGIDGQITNWAVRDYRGDDAALCGDEGLLYIDTNTPMMRTHGVDCLPLDFYLQALPRRLRPLLRPMARGVLNHYFDARTILLDFLANTSIHGRPDLVDAFLIEGNAFLADGLISPAPCPLTGAEVRRYISSDVMTWRLTRSLRAVEDLLDGRRGARHTVRTIRRIWTQPIF